MSDTRVSRTADNNNEPHLPIELNCKVSHLALAWLASKPTTSTVILGASKPEQILDNLKALEVLPKLTPEVQAKIEAILDNKPAAQVRVVLLLTTLQVAHRRVPMQNLYGRFPLDGHFPKI